MPMVEVRVFTRGTFLWSRRGSDDFGALMQEETVEPAANTRSYVALPIRYRTWLDQRDATLEVKDNACLPASVDLFDSDLMVGHGFDLRINGMAVRVEGFAGHCGGQVRRLEQRTVKGAA